MAPVKRQTRHRFTMPVVHPDLALVNQRQAVPIRREPHLAIIARLSQQWLRAPLTINQVDRDWPARSAALVYEHTRTLDCSREIELTLSGRQPSHHVSEHWNGLTPHL